MVSLLHRATINEVVHDISIGTKIGDLEWRNGPYFALFHRIFVYDVVAKQLGY